MLGCDGVGEVLESGVDEERDDGGERAEVVRLEVGRVRLRLWKGLEKFGNRFKVLYRGEIKERIKFVLNHHQLVF